MRREVEDAPSTLGRRMGLGGGVFCGTPRGDVDVAKVPLHESVSTEASKRASGFSFHCYLLETCLPLFLTRFISKNYQRYISAVLGPKQLTAPKDL